MLLCQGDLKISSAVRVVAQRPVNLRLPQILLEVVEQHSVLVCGNARGLRRKQRKRGVYILGREQLRLGLKLPDRRKDLRTA
jgi:rRNA-processing protein FCF1